MVNSNPVNRPSLTPDERSRLQSYEPHLQMAGGVFDDLEAIGVDVSADRDLLNRTMSQREGLLERFSASQLTPVKPPRARK